MTTSRKVLLGLGKLAAREAVREGATRLAAQITGKEQLLTQMAQEMYLSEPRVRKSWDLLPPSEQQIWKGRAAAAVRAIIQMIPESPIAMLLRQQR